MRLLLLSLLLVPAMSQASYAERPEVQAFMREMAKRHGFVEAELKRVFSKAQRAQPVLEAISRPAERVRTWEEYRSALLTERRVNEGMEFWKKYRKTLARAEK